MEAEEESHIVYISPENPQKRANRRKKSQVIAISDGGFCPFCRLGEHEEIKRRYGSAVLVRNPNPHIKSGESWLVIAEGKQYHALDSAALSSKDYANMLYLLFEAGFELKKKYTSVFLDVNSSHPTGRARALSGGTIVHPHMHVIAADVKAKDSFSNPEKDGSKLLLEYSGVKVYAVPGYDFELLVKAPGAYEQERLDIEKLGRFAEVVQACIRGVYRLLLENFPSRLTKHVYAGSSKLDLRDASLEMPYYLGFYIHGDTVYARIIPEIDHKGALGRLFGVVTVTFSSLEYADMLRGYISQELP